jgi:hypothetical protein
LFTLLNPHPECIAPWIQTTEKDAVKLFLFPVKIAAELVTTLQVKALQDLMDMVLNSVLAEM